MQMRTSDISCIFDSNVLMNASEMADIQHMVPKIEKNINESQFGISKNDLLSDTWNMPTTKTVSSSLTAADKNKEALFHVSWFDDV